MIGHGAILTGNFSPFPKEDFHVDQQGQNTPIDQNLEIPTEQGAEGLADNLRILLNAAMLFER